MIIELAVDQAAWDSYVDRSPQASNYHQWRWRRAVEETYGHKPHYLAAVENGAVRGILPLFEIRSRLFGTRLISMPFFSYGGPLVECDAARQALLRSAASLAGRINAHHVELRGGGSCGEGWVERSSKVGMEIPLTGNPDEFWKRISTGLRNKVRNGQKQGLRATWGGIEAVDQFYPVFAANMRNLGTPVYPKSWFRNLCHAAPDAIRILILSDGDKPVAGAFLAGFRDMLELPWSASLPESRKKYSQVLLYWTFLEWAMRAGYRRMDLGRCTAGGGTYEFKRHWMCEERPLCWSFWLAAGSSLPQLTPSSGHYQLAVQMWKRLPLPVANGLGPLIVRSIP